MKKIIFVTSNAHKLSEARAILGNWFDIISSKEMGFDQDIPETENSFQGNAQLKVKAYLKHNDSNDNILVMAEDSGLCVKALNGAPGIYSARFSGPNATDLKNNQKLLKELDEGKDRSAHFEACLCVFMDEKYHYFTGKIHGKIAKAMSGDEGFGYDPLFIPEQQQKTLAELGEEWKNNHCHRYNALTNFKKYLESEN